MAAEPIIRTKRLILRQWLDSDRSAFAEMNADAEVMADLGGPFSLAQSNNKLDRYAESFERNGHGRWVIEDGHGRFAGYAGVMRRDGEHPLGPHDEIGWRLVRHVWGRGYAIEAAHAALRDFLKRPDAPEVLSYTAPDNLRSQALMHRLRLARDPARDFVAEYETFGLWTGRVWAAPPDWLETAGNGQPTTPSFTSS